MIDPSVDIMTAGSKLCAFFITKNVKKIIKKTHTLTASRAIDFVWLLTAEIVPMYMLNHV